MAIENYKTKKGKRWAFSLMIAGKRFKRGGFYKEREAKKAEFDFLDSQEYGGKAKVNYSFDEVKDIYLNYRFKKIKITTKYSLGILCNNFNYFSRFINIDEITSNDLIKWEESLAVSQSRKNKIIAEFNRFLLFAFSRNYMKKSLNNILEKTTIYKIKSNVDFWTFEEYKLFIATFDDSNSEYKLFFETLYSTGMRLGEIQALTFADYNYDRSELNVEKTYTCKIGNGNSINIPPKSAAAVRKILLSKNLNLKIKSFSESKSDLERIFPYSATTLTKIKNVHCLLAGVKQIRIHDFRHSHASLLINDGASASAVAKRLGHSNPAITLSTYTHMFPSEQVLLLKTLDKFS